MKIKGSNIATDISFNLVINTQDFLLAVLDWREFDFKFREEVCKLLGYEEYIDDVVNDNFSVALVVPRTDELIDFNRSYLHILTIGIVDITQLTTSVIEQLKEDHLITVNIASYEKIDLLSRIIKTTDLRKVV